MSKGLDYTTPIPVQLLKDNNIDFVCRYVANPVSKWKMISQKEVGQLKEAGIAIVIVWESYADRPKEGRSAGAADARSAIDYLESIGIKDDVVIYFAIDFEVEQGEWGAVRSYFQGVGDVLPKERIGVYGGLKSVQTILDNNLATYVWQTLAWSMDRDTRKIIWEPRANIRQISTDQKWKGYYVDFNESVTDDFGQW